MNSSGRFNPATAIDLNCYTGVPQDRPQPVKTTSRSCGTLLYIIQDFLALLLVFLIRDQFLLVQFVKF